MKNDPEKACNSNANNKPATKNMSQTTNAYDTVVGKSFALEATFATSTRVSTVQKDEPIIYARPQKGKANCRNPIDVPFSIKQPTDENENTGLYSVVQKGKKTESISNTFVIDDVHGKDYYDSSLMEIGKEEAVENVYNKANFDHSVRDEDQTVNMYDKANFSHDSLQNNTGNDYDKANFYHGILENNTGNDYDKANFTHGILENNTGNDYDEANFRHEILEKKTINDYDGQISLT
ncbi:hypothetical protein ACJMK2_006815 [Sinanodonta woodiana]|uniref:Uncharacterized protein n=1 Tax=Sinanodonta woodiana TaxID=1069815 RepID=A0ABD3VUB1_SINWO